MVSAKTLGAVHTHSHKYHYIRGKLQGSSKKSVLEKKNTLLLSGIEYKHIVKRSSENLAFVLIQKMYIKYKRLKDGLCKKIACHFCVQKEVMNTS